MKERYRFLEGFEFSSCCVRRKDSFAFVGQKWEDNDPLELRHTGGVFYAPSRPPEKAWAFRYLGETLGADVCAPYMPEERWCFITKDGLVWVGGKGGEGWENEINSKRNVYITNVKSIRNGHATAIGSGRKVFVRIDINTWVPLDNGLHIEEEKDDLGKVGFLDIDGFSEKDMYACGQNGDLWHYDGSIWNKIDIPTNSVLYKLCCAGDGFVYIITNSRDVWKGRENSWTLIKQDLTDEVLEDIVDYREHVVISTVSELYHIHNDSFEVWNSGIPSMMSKAHLSANDGVLLVAGRDEAVSHDGHVWNVILEPA